MNMELSIIYS